MKLNPKSATPRLPPKRFGEWIQRGGFAVLAIVTWALYFYLGPASAMLLSSNLILLICLLHRLWRRWRFYQTAHQRWTDLLLSAAGLAGLTLMMIVVWSAPGVQSDRFTTFLRRKFPNSQLEVRITPVKMGSLAQINGFVPSMPERRIIERLLARELPRSIQRLNWDVMVGVDSPEKFSARQRRVTHAGWECLD